MNIFFNSNQEVIFLDKVEHLLVHNSSDVILVILICVSILLVLMTNGSLIYFIFRQVLRTTFSQCVFYLIVDNPEILFRQMSKTFLDWLVMLDCSLCICNIASLAGILMQQGTGTFCSFLAPFCFFTALLNRLLSMAVVIYRKIIIIYYYFLGIYLNFNTT